MNKRALPLVNTLIAAPCDVPWDSMQGDERTRHCSECKRDVHNLSAMTHAEVEAFLEALTPDASGHLPCISLFKRTDGTVLTTDCPVGLSARRRRSLLTATLGAGAVALVAMTAIATLWLDHTRALASDDLVDRPAVLDTKKDPPPPRFPLSIWLGKPSDRAPAAWTPQPEPMMAGLIAPSVMPVATTITPPRVVPVVDVRQMPYEGPGPSPRTKRIGGKINRRVYEEEMRTTTKRGDAKKKTEQNDAEAVLKAAMRATESTL